MPARRDDDENAPDHLRGRGGGAARVGDDASPAAGGGRGRGRGVGADAAAAAAPLVGGRGTPSGAMATLSMGTSTDATPADDSPADDRPLAERVSFGTQMTPVEPPPPLLMPPKERVSRGPR